MLLIEKSKIEIERNDSQARRDLEIYLKWLTDKEEDALARAKLAEEYKL